MQGEIASWFGDRFQGVDRPVSHNLPYNAAVMVQDGMGVMLTLRLACSYDNLKYVSLSPRLEFTSVLAWKERQIFSPLTSAFIDFAKKAYKGGVNTHGYLLYSVYIERG